MELKQIPASPNDMKMSMLDCTCVYACARECVYDCAAECNSSEEAKEKNDYEQL